MKLFVVFLVVGLSTSEKLNRAYLPPPGAKFSGGSAEYLQTPLENPKETSIYGPSINTETGFGDDTQKAVFINGLARNLDKDVKTGTPIDEGISIIPTGSPFSDTETAYPGGFRITKRPSHEQNTQNIPPGFGPINGHHRYSTKQETPNQFGTFRTTSGSFGKPSKMPFIIPKDIMQNYQPKAFGMYGGSPMIIKAHLGFQASTQSIPVNMFGNLNRNSKYRSSDLIKSDESIVSSSQKPDAYIVTSSAVNDKSESEAVFTTASSVKTVLPPKPNSRNAVAKYHQKRPERPQAKSDKNAVILNHKNVLTPKGYAYSFDTSNGIHKDESAITVDGVKAQGGYSYTGDDGKVYSVIYTADENGFQPRGDHLPTPPPIPKAIQKVIEQAKRDKQAGIIHDGSYDEEKYGHMRYQGPVNRYLQNMHTSSAVKSRNRVLGHKKITIKPIALKNRRVNKVKNDEIKDVAQNNGQKMAKLPKNDGQYDIQNVPSTEKRINANKIKVEKGEKVKYRRPIALPMRNIYQAQGLKFGKYKNLYKTTTPKVGYYYVPPKNIFIEGRFQDQSKLFKEVPNQYEKNYDNIDTTGVLPVYYIDQIDKYNLQDEPISKIANYITTTEEPVNLKEYESTNLEDDERLITVKMPSEGINITMTTAQPYVNTLSMNINDQDYTDGNVQKQETISLKNRDDFPSTRNDIVITSYQSTTPMPSLTDYTSKPLAYSNHYDTTYPPTGFDYNPPNSEINYPENEDYFRTTPEVPVNFEDFSSSTSIYPIDGKTDLTPNVKVDGFGRPILDTYEPNSNLPNTNINTEDVKTDDKSRPTYLNNFEGQITDIATSEIDKLNTSSDGGSEIERPTAINFNNEKMTVIGEDFSGPMQPQGYNPENGYFY